MNKKIKEKEAQKKPMTGFVPGLGMVNPLNPMMPMPFQMIPPGGQAPTLGVFPMMQHSEKYNLYHLEKMRQRMLV